MEREGGGAEGFLIPMTAEQVLEYEALQWLLKMFRGHDLWMDGTRHWSLPLNVMSNIRRRSAIDAIIEAKRRYDEHSRVEREADTGTGTGQQAVHSNARPVPSPTERDRS